MQLRKKNIFFDNVFIEKIKFIFRSIIELICHYEYLFQNLCGLIPFLFLAYAAYDDDFTLCAIISAFKNDYFWSIIFYLFYFPIIVASDHYFSPLLIHAAHLPKCSFGFTIMPTRQAQSLASSTNTSIHSALFSTRFSTSVDNGNFSSGIIIIMQSPNFQGLTYFLIIYQLCDVFKLELRY